jgi:hypothetical protein
MVYPHTPTIELAFRHLESAIVNDTSEDLSLMISELENLIVRAKDVQNLCSDFNSGSYLF